MANVVSLVLRVAVLVIAALSGFGVACILPDDHGIACGDGFVDVAVEEECDPLSDQPFTKGCEDGTRAVCNPTSCKVECRFCGDGVIDEPEECEPDVPIGEECDGRGFVSCTNCQLDDSTCDPCGNGVLDPGEECDYSLDDFADEDFAQCEGLAVPGNPDKTYVAGRRVCTAECRWDLSRCSLCGDGAIDGPIADPQTSIVIRPAEVCDGPPPPPIAASICAPHCPSVYEGVVCDVECADGCLEARVLDPQEPRCCLLGGAPKPAGAPPCCCELDNPDTCTPVEAPEPGGDPICPFSS